MRPAPRDMTLAKSKRVATTGGDRDLYKDRTHPTPSPRVPFGTPDSYKIKGPFSRLVGSRTTLNSLPHSLGFPWGFYWATLRDRVTLFVPSSSFFSLNDLSGLLGSVSVLPSEPLPSPSSLPTPEYQTYRVESENGCILSYVRVTDNRRSTRHRTGPGN